MYFWKVLFPLYQSKYFFYETTWFVFSPLMKDPGNIYLLKVNGRKRCEICSKVTIKTTEQMSANKKNSSVTSF